MSLGAHYGLHKIASLAGERIAVEHVNQFERAPHIYGCYPE